MFGAEGREVHRQAGGCGIDVITHLAQGKRRSVTLNNQMALHHPANFPPLRLFYAAAGVVAGEKQETSVRFISWTQQLLQFAHVLQRARGKTAANRVDSLLLFGDECIVRRFYFSNYRL